MVFMTSCYFSFSHPRAGLFLSAERSDVFRMILAQECDSFRSGRIGVSRACTPSGLGSPC